MITENVRQDLITLVPLSILNNISCFVFYDNHPRDNKSIDVLVCTHRREVIEYYKRKPISSIILDSCKNLLQVRSLRNTKCDLFYLVVTDDELYIISSKQKLKLEHKITDVESYEVYDLECSGQASLKIIRKDDAVPLVFDDNFENFAERCINIKTTETDDLTPIQIQLMRKLTEAKYSVQCKKNTYNEFVNLRQAATFYLWQKICPNIDDAVFKVDTKEILSLMLLKTRTPWIKLCNKKIIIAFNLLNKDIIPLEEVYVLLHSTAKGSIVYDTKLFKKHLSNWVVKEDQVVNPYTEIAVVTNIDLKELQNNVTMRVEFDMVLAFKKSSKDYLLPFDKVIITASDIMGEDFDVLGNPHLDEEKMFLAILATSKKTELCLRHIKDEGEPSITDAEIFCKHLKMDQLATAKNVAIHKTSPYHILHGVMVIFEKQELERNDKFTVQVYSRCPSQVLALIHYINDVVPFRIIATTQNYKITANTEQLTNYNEEVPIRCDQGKNYQEYASSILNQTSMLLEYLDDCMIKMNESKNNAIQSKVGCEIDVLACGLDKFTEFRNNLLNEVSSGILKCLRENCPMVVQEESSDMIVDGE